MRYILKPMNTASADIIKKERIDLKAFKDQSDAEEYANAIEEDYPEVKVMVVEENNTEETTTVVDTAKVEDSGYDISNDEIVLVHLNGKEEVIDLKDAKRLASKATPDKVEYKYLMDNDTGVILFDFATGEVDSDFDF